MDNFIYEKNEKDEITMYTAHRQTFLGCFYMEVDGFYVFEPATRLSGYYNEYFLIIILNKLKELNKDWEEELNRYFNDNPV